MIWYVIIGMFGAFGALCALWIFLGNWLTQGALGCIVVHPPLGREAVAARRLLWLQDLGLIQARLVIVTPSAQPCTPQQLEPIEFLTLEQYIAQLIEERNELDGI